jgi:hypothetical protein
VIVATNHSEFEAPQTLELIHSLVADDCLLVDPWNSLGTSQVFVYAAEARLLSERRNGAGNAADHTAARADAPKPSARGPR